jgi:DNA-binding MarR family transcriptional regulator
MRRRAENRAPAEIIAAECIAVRIRALNRAITALYDGALRPHGLRVSQLNLLVAIALAGPARAGELCRILRMDKSTLSRDLEVLRRNGWMDEDELGGRARLLKISPTGQTLLERSIPAWRQAQTRARELIGQEAAEAILKVIQLPGSDGSPGL